MVGCGARVQGGGRGGEAERSVEPEPAAVGGGDAGSREDGAGGAEGGNGGAAVSYTHLTLPTICSV
eukprot:1172293-Rhodomonas_salina.2